MRELDEHDDDVYAEAFLLAEAVRRFLARTSTRAIIAAGLLDPDVTNVLVEASERMTTARLSRVKEARREA